MHPIGLKGGLLLAWMDSFRLDIVISNDNVINVLLYIDDLSPSLFSFV